MKLFDIPATEPATELKTCKDCQHRERWECGSMIIQYCGVLKSNRTFNKKKKIKAKDKACLSFKQIIK